jgi:Lrp/AsnC family transcriptional regulator for asnA, asnC and gidA
MKRRRSSGLDSVDTQIIAELQSDGRRPNTEIARRLGLAEGTIRKRIDHLRREKVMQIGAWADPLKIGYQYYAFIELQVDLAKIETVAERLAKLTDVFFVGIGTGLFDIIAAAVFRSNEHMHEFMIRDLARIPGIRRSCTSNITRIVKREYVFPVSSTTMRPPAKPEAAQPPRRRARMLAHRAKTAADAAREESSG